MIITKTLSNALLVPALAFATAAFAAAPAAAQTQPQAQPLPSYAVPGDTVIHGTVRSIDGRYDITVRDANGYLDHVTLHDGTIINPTGLRLAPGQSVTIAGRPDGNTFAANEIDTPYAFRYPVYGYPYPYPGYGYYPRYAVGFGFHTRGFGFRGFF